MNLQLHLQREVIQSRVMHGHNAVLRSLAFVVGAVRWGVSSVWQ